MSVFVLSHTSFCLIPKGSHLDSKLPGDKNFCAQHFAPSSTWSSTWFGIEAQCLLLASNPSFLWFFVPSDDYVGWVGDVEKEASLEGIALCPSPPTWFFSWPPSSPTMVFKVGMEQAGLWTWETVKTSHWLWDLLPLHPTHQPIDALQGRPQRLKVTLVVFPS